MTNLTTDEKVAQNMTAAAYIAETNAVTRAMAKAEGWTMWTTMASESYADCTTGYDVMAQNAVAEYRDAYKEAYNFRPSHTPEGTPSEIAAMCRELYEVAACSQESYEDPDAWLNDNAEAEAGNRSWTF